MEKPETKERKYWIGVASLEHVRAAVHGGFCQLNHGKEAPVRRLKRSDILVYYSPRESMGEGVALQAFSAAGSILDDEPYRVEQAPGFKPFRRKTHYFETRQSPIQSLLKALTFTRDHSNWGFAFRRGVFSIDREDFVMIAEAMNIPLGNDR